MRTFSWSLFLYVLMVSMVVESQLPADRKP